VRWALQHGHERARRSPQELVRSMTPVIAGFTMLAIVVPIFGFLALLESIDL
jgi:hypothetical protein